MTVGKNQEASDLSSEILRNFELSEISFEGIIAKCLRLARLRGDLEAMAWLSLELSGYPSTPEGVPPKEWSLGAKSLRQYQHKDVTGVTQTLMYTQSVGTMEAEILAAKAQLQVSNDPNVSLSTSNPYQHLYPPSGNFSERTGLRNQIALWTGVLDKVRSAVYMFALGNYYELKFANINESIFERTRNRVDELLAQVCPEAVKELVSAYQNIESTNEKDWSNTGNSCRRLLKELADSLFPPQKDIVGGHKLTDEAYINRLLAFVEKNSKSKNFDKLVGSQLSFLANRLDAINSTSSKGVHSALSKDEVERLVIYTYLVAGDILSLYYPAKEEITPQVMATTQIDPTSPLQEAIEKLSKTLKSSDLVTESK